MIYCPDCKEEVDVDIFNDEETECGHYRICTFCKDEFDKVDIHDDYRDCEGYLPAARV